MTICQTFLDDLWQTEDGARVLMYCLAFSAAKDRKTTIKAFSGMIDFQNINTMIFKYILVLILQTM